MISINFVTNKKPVLIKNLKYKAKYKTLYPNMNSIVIKPMTLFNTKLLLL